MRARERQGRRAHAVQLCGSISVGTGTCIFSPSCSFSVPPLHHTYHSAGERSSNVPCFHQNSVSTGPCHRDVSCRLVARTIVALDRPYCADYASSYWPAEWVHVTGPASVERGTERRLYPAMAWVSFRERCLEVCELTCVFGIFVCVVPPALDTTGC